MATSKALPAKLTYPVDLSPFIPNVDPTDANSMIRMESDFIRETDKKLTPDKADVAAGKRIVAWYLQALDNKSTIERVGLTRWVTSYRAPMVWATLLGLKNAGINDLPLGPKN